MDGHDRASATSALERAGIPVNHPYPQNRGYNVVAAADIR